MSDAVLSSRNFLHPFPARMAPDIALQEIEKLPANSKIIDPMMGSGTVLLAANQAGLTALGTDLDPLAVLISNVSNSQIDGPALADHAASLVYYAKSNEVSPSELPWIEVGDETHKFINYWFAENQQRQLASLVNGLLLRSEQLSSTEYKALQLAISKTIVTKEMRASLARDTSHSRPHRVAITNDYDVYAGFTAAVADLIKKHGRIVRSGEVTTRHGDARSIEAENQSFDALITSPPYLNAIDYLRGHRLALVWLGHRFQDLRGIRSASIGAERSSDEGANGPREQILGAFGRVDQMDARHRGMIGRYALDLYGIAKESYRVLREGSRAIYVIGNSCLRGVYIDNASALQVAAELNGFRLAEKIVREIPERTRYLPIRSGNLSRRMRTEVVLSFTK